MFIQSLDFELWLMIINNPFIHTHHINGEVVDKPDFLLTLEEKRKFEIDFKTNNFLVIYLSGCQFIYVYNLKPDKEMRDIFYMIDEVSPKYRTNVDEHTRRTRMFYS